MRLQALSLSREGKDSLIDGWPHDWAGLEDALASHAEWRLRSIAHCC